MYPLINLGPIQIPSYGTVIFIGLVLGIIIALKTSHKYNIEKLDILLSCILASIGMIVGAKIIYFITILPEIIKNIDIVKTHIPQTIVYAFSGYVFYGGLIGALLSFLFYCKRFKISFFNLSNIIAPVIPLIHSFGRIGCFLGGCCYGIEYHGIFSVRFPQTGSVHGLGDYPRFPVQLLESLLNFILFLILYMYGRKVRKSGQLLGIYLSSYSVIRFLLEFLRGDVERGILLGVSTSQWISLLLLPVGFYLIFRKENTQKESNNIETS